MSKSIRARLSSQNSLSEIENAVIHGIKNIGGNIKEYLNKEATSQNISKARGKKERRKTLPLDITSERIQVLSEHIGPDSGERGRSIIHLLTSPACCHKSTQTPSQEQWENECKGQLSRFENTSRLPQEPSDHISRENAERDDLETPSPETTSMLEQNEQNYIAQERGEGKQSTTPSPKTTSLQVEEGPDHSSLGLKCPANRRRVLYIFLGSLILVLIITVIVLSVKSLEPKIQEGKVAACSIISEDNCPDGWLGYRRKCYYFAETERNWTSSMMNCTSFNASLALVDFQDDMDFLSRYKTPADYWIGLQRDKETEPWKWANGTIFNNWFQVRGGGECAYLNHKGAASSFCDREIRWICSKPKERMCELSRA